MFTTLVAIGTVLMQIATGALIILWIIKSPLLKIIKDNSHFLIAGIFIASAIISLIYQYGFGYEPCLLCWYQRIGIFGIAIVSLTGDIRKNKMLQKQILIFSIFGLAFALLHNYTDIFPGSIDICGAGASCLKRYIYEFGYITIPMMSLTALTLGFVLTLINIKESKTISLE